MDRYVIIIGAMKSGTTTLVRLLKEHPQIAGASHKEPGFFAFEEVWQKGYDWYHALFDFDPARHVYRLEASTDYTKHPFVSGVWDRMTAEPGKDFRLIYIMRDPIDRMQSHARHTQHARKELGQILSDRPDHSLDYGPSLLSLATSQYALQIDQFQDALDAGVLHLTTLDALKRDPVATMARIYDFLDLDPPSLPEEAPRANDAHKRRALSPVYGTLTRLPGVLPLAKAIFPKSLRDRIKAKFERQVTLSGRFTFREDERAALRALLASDLERLDARYGVRENWGREASARDVRPDTGPEKRV